MGGAVQAPPMPHQARVMAGGAVRALPVQNQGMVAGGGYAPPITGPHGASGWPAGVPPPVGPLGTAGWATGLPEQARGTGQATQFGLAGASSAPPYPSSQHSVPTGMGSMMGCQAAEPATVAALDTNPNARSLMKLTPYNGSGSLETFLEKFGCM